MLVGGQVRELGGYRAAGPAGEGRAEGEGQEGEVEGGEAQEDAGLPGKNAGGPRLFLSLLFLLLKSVADPDPQQLRKQVT
jgi:hypothetical protein